MLHEALLGTVPIFVTAKMGLSPYPLLSPVVNQIGWVLIHSLWQFAAAAMVAAVLQWTLRRRSAAARYGVLLAAMSIIVALPAVTWFAIGPIEKPLRAGVPASAGPSDNSRLKAELQRPEFLPPRLNDELPKSDALPVEVAKPQAPTVLSKSEPQEPVAWWSQVKNRLEPWLPVVVLVWIGGVALFAFRPLASWYTVRRLRTVGVSPVADAVRDVLDRTAKRLRLARAVSVLQSTLVKTPIVIGWFRPLVLLPACIVTGVPESQLELILAHELAHIRRHDYLVNLLQTLIETLFFYHPAVWWLSRQIRNERENCCDDVALSLSSNRADYGRALLAIEELRAASPALSVAATGGSLLARIRRIAGRESAPRAVGGAILPSFLAAIAILAAVTWAAALAPTQSTAAERSGNSAATARSNATGQTSAEKPASKDKAIEERAKATKNLSWDYRHRRHFIAFDEDRGQFKLVGQLVTSPYWHKLLPLTPAQASEITKLNDLVQDEFDNAAITAADYVDTNPPD
jgi:beta-lactamase regulating signal transducer with metallopeptidase domain